MTVVVDAPDFAGVPLEPAVQVGALDHPALHRILNDALPGVRHERQEPRSGRTRPDEVHLLIDSVSGSAARVVIAWNARDFRAECRVAVIGPRDLLAELASVAPAWLSAGHLVSTPPVLEEVR